MNQYKLLRGNKESGPYTAAQLIGMGFKAYDLLWQEGRSAAWRYPSEIEEFKNYAPLVEEQPFDRFYKKNTSQKTPAKVISEIAIPSITAEVKKDKPRIKIIPEWQQMEGEKKVAPPLFESLVNNIPETKLKISVPQTVAENSDTVISKKNLSNNKISNPSWQDAWLSWENERKTVFALSKEQNETPASLETKFSQSLDSIKERYVESVLNKKTKAAESAQFRNYITVAAIALVLICGGIWLGARNTKTDLKPTFENNQQVSTSIAKPTEINNSGVPESSEEPLPQSLANESSSASVSIVPVSTKPVTKKPAAKKSLTNSDKKAAAVNHSLPVNNSSKIQKQTTKIITTKPLQEKQETGASNISQVKNTEKPEPKSVFKRAAAGPKISDYISISSNANSSGDVSAMQYQIHNTGDIPIELVMVDLQYFNSSGGFVKGETIYIRNIKAGETVIASPPANKNAVRVTAKVSMITSAANDLYLIAD